MKKKIIIICLITLICTIFLISFYNKKISPLLIKYSEIKSKKIAIDIISKNVSKEVNMVLDNKDLFVIEKDNEGNIETIDYNTKIVNEILSVSSKTVLKNFEKIEKNNDGIFMKVPIGVVSNNVFLENLGPKIPIKLELDGNILTSLKTKVKEYGINSALIEVSVKIEANIDVIVPFKSTEIKVINEVPISIKLAKGNVSSILNKE